ncbi:hypothetical protein [uncultured Clostridium sp.]|uniref:hypothetical protein n=1 Tax=uncultured Clostridium sp. TaxID=59620 RepID=UPI0026386C4D|nr:hypothetical protein [uncultured Clostridium sp.]
MPQNFEDLKGKIVRDPDGYFYLVLRITSDVANSQKKMVLYRDFYNENNLFILPKNIFLDINDKKFFPNSTQKFLFQTVDKADSVPPFIKPKQSKSIIRDSVDFYKKFVQGYKGTFCFVHDLVYDGFSNEPFVLYGEINLLPFVAPKKIFLGTVNLEKHPDAIQPHIYEVVDSNTALHLFPKQKDLIPLKGHVIRRFNKLYYVVIDQPHDPITGTDFVLMKGLFGKYDLKLLPRSYFLSELESKRSSKYKEKYIYNLVEPDKVPSKPSFHNWFIKERSIRFQYNMFWGSILIISYVFLFVFLILKS